MISVFTGKKVCLCIQQQVVAKTTCIETGFHDNKQSFVTLFSGRPDSAEVWSNWSDDTKIQTEWSGFEPWTIDHWETFLFLAFFSKRVLKNIQMKFLYMQIKSFQEWLCTVLGLTLIKRLQRQLGNGRDYGVAECVIVKWRKTKDSKGVQLQNAIACHATKK